MRYRSELVPHLPGMVQAMASASIAHVSSTEQADSRIAMLFTVNSLVGLVLAAALQVI